MDRPDAPHPPATGRGQAPLRRGARTTQRRGRMTEARRAALDRLGPRYGLPIGARLDAASLDARFGRRAPRLLDIGVGNGTATLAWAEAHPDRDVVAVELHRPGIAFLLRAIEEAGLTNVAVLEADVTTLLPPHASGAGGRAWEPGAVDEVRILFPDPWPKARHRRRRLVDEAFVAAVCDRLPLGGRLHLATDWLDYADQVRAALATEPRLAPRVDHDDGPVPGDAPVRRVAAEPPRRWRSERPDRPVTAYERRGLDAGRPITDLLATRTA